MRWAAFFSVLFFVACSDRTGIPNDIIPTDSMQVILKDVVMASEYAAHHISKDSLNRHKTLSNEELLDAIFQIHHISRDQFKKSLGFYESRPDLSKKIFDSLSAYAGRHQRELYIPSPIPSLKQNKGKPFALQPRPVSVK
jgi:hypothetical protein